jgi:hypothetical protein
MSVMDTICIFPSFPNSIWERNCPRNSIALMPFCRSAMKEKSPEGSATELPQQVRSQMEFGNEEGEVSR